MNTKQKPSQASYLMTDAVEGSGIAYWALLDQDSIKRDNKLPRAGYVIQFKVTDGGFENDPINDKWVTINEATILTAVDKILKGDIPIRRDIAAQFVGKTWEYDSEGVDAVIQAILFGSIQYG
jgi:hypothetical protein